MGDSLIRREDMKCQYCGKPFLESECFVYNICFECYQRKKGEVGLMANRVIIEVSGGVADCTAKPKGITVIIIDHDNEKECEGYEPQEYTVDEEIIEPF